MKKLFIIRIVTLIICMMSTSVYADESTEAKTGKRARDELDAAWRDGFMAAMEDWKYVPFDENLNFRIPFAEHDGVFFEAGFLFNGFGWDLDASSINVLDNVLLLTEEDDGGMFTLKTKGVLRIRLYRRPPYYIWCFLKDMDPEILYQVKYIETSSHVTDIPLIIESGNIMSGVISEQEWSFVAGKSGVVTLEMAACANPAQCGVDAEDYFSVEIVVE